MIRPSEKILLSFCLFLIVMGCAVALPAQRTDERLPTALRETREAGIAEEILNQLLALAYEKQLEPSGMADLLLILARCQKEHLPLEPFLSKLEEGISKEIPPSQIGKVLESRREDYRFTRSLIQESGNLPGQVEPASAESFVRLTETLYCGLSRENLAGLLGTFPGTPLPLVSKGAEVLASLKQMHFNPDYAKQIVDTGVKQGYFTLAQRDFARIVALAKRKGLQDDQIAAVALEVIESRGSQNDLSSRLGITDRERSRRALQPEKKSAASKSPAKEEGDTATSRSHKVPDSELPQIAPSGIDSKSIDRAPPVRTLDHAETPVAGNRSDPVHDASGSGGSRSTKTSDPIRTSDSIDLWDAGKGSVPVHDTNTSKGPKTTKTADPAHTSDSTSRSDTGKGSDPVHDASTDKGPKTAKTADPARTSDSTGSSAPGTASEPVHGSTVGNSLKPANNSAPIFRSGNAPKKGQKRDERLTFAAAGTVIEIDPDILSLTLDINEAYRVPEGYRAPFVINEKAVFQAESSELGVFDVALGDLAIAGEYLRVLGKIQADGTYLVNHIVLGLDGISSLDDMGSSELDQTGQAKEETVAFAAVGTVVEIDPDGLTLTLIVDKANRVLEQESGSQAHFSIGNEARVKAESSQAVVFDLDLHDIPVGQDDVRVFGKKLADGSLLISQIIVHLEE
jgi:hypothetical protein